MTSVPYDNLSDLTPATYNWSIKVRIVRSWRGVSKTGEGFKGLNLIMLDDKDTRMHCFVPGNIVDTLEEKLKEGKICNISNFSVKEYREDEKFRCVHSDKQIILTAYTEVNPSEEDDSLIARNMFDFYDLTDLGAIANKNIYLTDVVGVIEKIQPLSNLINKFGKHQVQIKFNIVDPRCSINVTFWDSIAENFEAAFRSTKEFPAVIIIASAKITSWQGTTHNTPQIEVSNASATKFYINLDDPNVLHMRKMLKGGKFKQYDFSSQMPRTIPLMSIKEIEQLEMDYGEKEVMCEIKLKRVIPSSNFFIYECSSCYKQIEPVEGSFKCYRCVNRNVPHPYKRWFFPVEAEDLTGTITMWMQDRETRLLTGVDAEDLQLGENSKKTPAILKTIQNKFYTIKLLLKPGNNQEDSYIYNISEIVLKNEDEICQSENMQDSMTQASPSSIHLDDFSQLNFKSPNSTKRKKRSVAGRNRAKSSK